MARRRAVLVAGSLHYDFVVSALHLPARDETVMGSGVQFICGGKGGNQAVAASVHGAKTYMAGCVADDFFGQRLSENLEAASVDVSLMQHAASGVSGMSVAIMEETGDYGAVVVSGVNRLLESAAFEWPADAAMLVLQNEVPEAVNVGFARLAEKNGVPVILNAAPMRATSADILDRVTILVVNTVEAGTFFGAPARTAEEVLTLAGARSDGPRELIVTLGGEGAVHHHLGEDPRHVPAFDVPVVSTHGAGDAFVGALAARLTSGDAMQAALRYAMAAAALIVATHPEDRTALSPRDVAALVAGTPEV